MTALDVRQEGYLKRLKTQKRRYFVLRTLSACGQPRLEYYESEKKFRSNCTPKRVIQLASCFNIAQKYDTKHNFVLALYTRDDVFGLICESKEDLQSWMEDLLKEQSLSASLNGNEYLSDNVDGEVQLPASVRKDYFASAPNVSSWPVIVKPRGLGTSKNLAGAYDLKLADHTLNLQKPNSGETVADFHLTMVRRCGHTDCFFFMEVGRSSVTGAGELWMQVDDPILAQNLHEVVLIAMQSMSSDSGYSSISRYRCHSGGHKARPSSLLLLTPHRCRSDTLPDSAEATQDGATSPTKQKEAEQSSPSGSKRSAMFQRLLSVGKRKSEILDFSPRLFSRRSQSKSLSIDPCPVGLHGRAQSVDFSTLFRASHVPNSPVTPDSPKEREINFEIDEAFRTSSTSSGSSGRSWDRSLPRKYSLEEGTRRDSGTLTPSSRASEVPDEGYDSTSREDNTVNDNQTPDDVSKDNDDEPDDIISRDDKTLEREPYENQDEDMKDPFEESNDNSNHVVKKPLQRNHSGYEDMSGSLGCDTIEESAEENDITSYNETESTPKDNSLECEVFHPQQHSPMQRRISAPAISDSPVLEQVQLQSKYSPKQRRTSEPLCKISDEFRELVTIRDSPLSSPRRSRKSTSSTTNGTIMEDTGSPPSSPGRRQSNDSGEYVDMGLFKKHHTYVNLNPKEGYKPDENSAYISYRSGDKLDSPKGGEEPAYMNFRPIDRLETPKGSEEPAYMNFRPKDSLETPKGSEEPAYMNFRPKESLEAPKSEEPAYMNFRPKESVEAPKSEEPAYMNFRPGQIAVQPSAEESPSYINFGPGDFQTIGRSGSGSPRQKSKHTYENCTPNGTLKTDESEFRDYMNINPPTKYLFNRKSLPARRPTSGKMNRDRRRESEPTVNMGLMSDEENGMLFLDFSGNKSTPSKGLNYISLDLSKREKPSKASKPLHINTPDYSTAAWDVGPKSAPVSSTSQYAEIDFTKSHGLRQAIIDHKKTKTLKE